MNRTAKNKGINIFILWVYLWLVFMTQVYKENNLSGLLYVAVLCWLGVVLAFVSKALIGWVSHLEIKECKLEMNKCDKRKMFLWAFIISLCVFFAYYFASYPGCFSPDSINQYDQILTGVYNDWHPVLHTLLFFWLPLTVTGGWNGSIILFQIIWLSLALAYMTVTIRCYSNKWAAYIALAFILLNPSTGRIAMFPWKDTGFMIAALVIMCYMMRVYFTKGEWFNKSSNLICFAVACVLATVFRHNAILFTLPMLIAGVLYAGKKARLRIIVVFLVLLLAVKGPLYSLLQVEKPDKRRSEMLGLPMTVIANVVKHNQGKLDSEMWDYVYRIAPHEAWQSHWTGSFNSMKWNPLTNVNEIDRMGAKKALMMMLKGFSIAPDSAMQGLISLTDVVYAFDKPQIRSIGESRIQTNYLEYKSSQYLYNKLKAYENMAYRVCGILFGCIGAMNLLVLLCILAKTNLRRKHDLKKALLALPMLVYNFGTMLLLTGPEDFRFFYFSFVITPVIIILMLRKETTNVPVE